jgi:hypothetical protein
MDADHFSPIVTKTSGFAIAAIANKILKLIRTLNFKNLIKTVLNLDLSFCKLANIGKLIFEIALVIFTEKGA